METGVEFKSKAEAMRRTGFTRYKLDKSIKQGTEVTNNEGYTDSFELVDPPVAHETGFIVLDPTASDDNLVACEIYRAIRVFQEEGYEYDEQDKGFEVELDDRGYLPAIARAILGVYCPSFRVQEVEE